MKRIVSILIPVAVLAVAMLAGCGTKAPESAAALLYERYASRSELMVARIDGMQLNDSVKVDVVILEADSDADWQQLCREFDVRSQSGMVTWIGDPTAPQTSIPYEGGACCKVIASPARRTIGLYLLEDEVQYESLMDYRMALMEQGEE